MFRRFGFFFLMNLGIMLVLGLIVNLFGLNRFLSASGINYPVLFLFSLVIGFGGSMISLFLSKTMAVRAYRIRLIQPPANESETWIYRTVEKFASQSGLPMPEVGIYHSPEPNAFATGPSKKNSLVAVSTGLLGAMTKKEVEAVLAHEVGHIANGDMVTMTLLQGVLNTFVVFFAKVAAFFIGRLLSGSRDEDGEGGFSPLAYMAVSFILEMVFGVLAQIVAMSFSRLREYRADAFAAELSGRENMISALRRLSGYTGQAIDNRNPQMAAMMISNFRNFSALFASHPPLEKRIESLAKLPGNR